MLESLRGVRLRVLASREDSRDITAADAAIRVALRLKTLLIRHLQITFSGTLDHPALLCTGMYAGSLEAARRRPQA